MSFVPETTQPQLTFPTPQTEGTSTTEIYSIIVTLAMGVGLGVLASLSARHTWVIWLAVSVGGLGGLVHEIAQSGGKILFFERKLDGIYIGSLAGIILGSVAGLLAVRGLIVNPTAQPSVTQLIYEAFLAGIALKGITEAAGGQALPAGSDSVTPAQAMAAEASVNQIASGQPILTGRMPPAPETLP